MKKPDNINQICSVILNPNKTCFQFDIVFEYLAGKQRCFKLCVISLSVKIVNIFIPISFDICFDQKSHLIEYQQHMVWLRNNMPLVKSAKQFSYFSTKTYVVGTQKNVSMRHFFGALKTYAKNYG